MPNFIEYRPWPLLLKASWQGAVLIVLVLAARSALGRRLSPRWRCGLWLLVVLRLALPWTIPSAVSLFNFLNFSRASEAVINSSPADHPAPQVAGAAATAEARDNANFSWLPLVWAAGAWAMALGLGATHCRLARRVTPCRHLIDTQVLSLLEDCKQLMGVRAPVALVETAAVDGPCLFGFLRPRLLLPAGFTRDFSLEELRFVFLHELGHVKRHDIPLGWLMAWLQILHWFNPLVWLAFSRMRMDRELACDAMALSYAQAQDHKPYARTIVKLLEHFGDSLRAPSLAGIVEDKQQMKERILMIAQFHKSNRGVAVAASLFVILGLLTLTDAQLGCKSPTAAAADKTVPPNAQKQAATPRIISSSPAAGAQEVDPALTEITVTFNQDMGDGMSWTGGGPELPPLRQDQKAQWRDKRTCVLPVKLEAGHYYRVGLNSTSYQNFASDQGVAALPCAIFFTTQGASAELKARTLAPQVVHFDPENGAQNVSPALTELRVTFSVPMGDGCSWCTVSDNAAEFPKIREGKGMYWTEDKKTCVLPVELKPGLTYRMSLNDPEYKNFQSDAGVPLAPAAYSFKTSGPGARTQAAGHKSESL
jgi:beta-lactamase regulating signal transducer with metallopeptidase domain